MARLEDLTEGAPVRGVLPDRAAELVGVRLLDGSEFPRTWDPATGGRVPVWEVAQNAILALEPGGESNAAEFLRRVGGLGETVEELAHRLDAICERKKWAKEALAYNPRVLAWPEISRLAAGGSPTRSLQQEML